MIRFARGGLLFATAMSMACAHAKTRQSGRFHAEISDPAGDAQPVQVASRGPDLVRGIVDVRDGLATFDIRFAPGTFDPASTRVTIQLDTDQVATTGIGTVYGLGIDFTLDLWAPMGWALVLKAVPSGACTAVSPCYVRAGSGSLTLLDDGMKVTVPLSLLGNCDGRMDFRVLSYAAKPGGSTSLPTNVSDMMPDAGQPNGRLQ